VGFSFRYIFLTFLVACLVSGCHKSPVQPDPIAPKITCPATQTAASVDGETALVTYPDPVVTGGKLPLTTNCSPLGGALFPAGVTTVTCKTTDSLQRADACTFEVHVTTPPRISLTNFIAFGDSITWGEDGLSLVAGQSSVVHPEFQVAPGSRYPDLLETKLRSVYTAQVSDITVRNDGMKGEVAGSRAALDRFRSDVLTASYQAVLLVDGANDIADPKNVPAAIANLGRMIDEAKGRNIRPYLGSLPPEQGNGFPRRGQAPQVVMAYNAQLRNLAAQRGVDFVDVYSPFPGGDLIASGYLGADGLHPTADLGYPLMADAFFESLKATLELPPAFSSILKGHALPHLARP
jgi:lysophospholipase L1-like esterase